ncbi:MAG: flagellar motor protein MotB [Candidatus Sericytochromatia bacterium]|nr:flagellar motor protein MotB [Candidatus Sericytochromatia bacterium]
MRSKDWRLQREGEEEQHSDRERWLITYADFITLLMVFFVVMYALSSRISSENFAKITQSLKQSLSIKKKDGQDIFANTPAKVKTDQIQEAQARVKQAIAKFDGRSQVRVDLQDRGLVISLYDTAFFDANSTDLKPPLKQALRKAAEALQKMPNAISVEGHTDNLSPGGGAGTNWRLAGDRAIRVVEFLVREGKIAPKRLSATSYAEYRPLFPNDTPQHRALNRRVDLVVSAEAPKAALTPSPTPSDQLLAPGYSYPTPGGFQNPFNNGGINNPFGSSY